jgi:aminoglycoside phosphotransferase (APT) family kinase protein
MTSVAGATAGVESVSDATGSVRAGEDLDVAAVDAWLKQRLPELHGAPRVTQYRGGASNWTYRLLYENRDLVLRRPPAGTKARSAHDMAREYRVQQALRPSYPSAPKMIALCQDSSVLGADFYVMERIDGIVLRTQTPAALGMDAKTARALCLTVIDKLIELHRVDLRAVGLETLGKGPGYPRRQVEGWGERYEQARTWNVPSFCYVRDWLRAHTPADAGTCVIHNDFRFDNVVLAAGDLTRVVGVLDWEMSTVGDPLMDLGGALAYWVEAGDDFVRRATRRQPTHLPGMLTRGEVVDYYLERTGLRPECWAFYEVYGLFRLAGIVQQIYYRYHRRQTRNPAFRRFWVLSNYLDWRCRRLIAKIRS